MRKYELMVIYPIEEDKSKAGIEETRSILAQFGAAIEKEEPYGDRDLAYEIKKQKKGRFMLFTLTANPAKLVEIQSGFRLNHNILKYLFVRLDEKK